MRRSSLLIGLAVVSVSVSACTAATGAVGGESISAAASVDSSVTPPVTNRETGSADTSAPSDSNDLGDSVATSAQSEIRDSTVSNAGQTVGAQDWCTAALGKESSARLLGSIYTDTLQLAEPSALSDGTEEPFAVMCANGFIGIQWYEYTPDSSAYNEQQSKIRDRNEDSEELVFSSIEGYYHYLPNMNVLDPSNPEPLAGFDAFYGDSELIEIQIGGDPTQFTDSQARDAIGNIVAMVADTNFDAIVAAAVDSQNTTSVDNPKWTTRLNFDSSRDDIASSPDSDRLAAYATWCTNLWGAVYAHAPAQLGADAPRLTLVSEGSEMRRAICDGGGVLVERSEFASPDVATSSRDNEFSTAVDMGGYEARNIGGIDGVYRAPEENMGVWFIGYYPDQTRTAINIIPDWGPSQSELSESESIALIETILNAADEPMP